MAREKTDQSARQPKPAVPIDVVPGSLQRIRPKGGEAYAVQVPKRLANRDVRAEFGNLLYSSGVASGVAFDPEGGWVLVSIDGHRGVRLAAEQWLVVTQAKAYALDDKTMRERFEFDEVAAPAEVVPGPSAVVTEP
jgi:hypothetical protein